MIRTFWRSNMHELPSPLNLPQGFLVRRICTQKPFLAYKCHEKWHSWYRQATHFHETVLDSPPAFLKAVISVSALMTYSLTLSLGPIITC